MPGQKKKYFQDPLFQEFQADTCYVCCERIQDGKGVCVGHGLWRHVNCKPGSRKWSGSNIEERITKSNFWP